ncbi:hypothetical protein CLV80_101454 [Yoonia maritima]|uniref:Uncharacterized protein n=1 Tax=Yoonia maritima TaxID=1435347 RepID=A0A2T0W542_9RHOB|nr:hypothetical protein [Yoonia maritima]PRY80599.1 hypothetical protein CLV80_101454 [Yoonia maritima]
MKFLLTVLLGAVLGAAGTLYYIYLYHADGSEQALMRNALTTYLPFLSEYINK